MKEREREREILLSFWKVPILHHAAHGPVFGLWTARELRRHGYEISPGTLYPLLARLEERGWLVSSTVGSGRRARREYVIAEKRRTVLVHLREKITEMYREVVLGARP